MTTAVVAVRPRALALGRAAALAALASAAVHLLLLDAGSLGSLVMVLMAVACLPCAWHLWRSPAASVWRFTALVDAGMLVLHLQMPDGSSMDMPGMDGGSTGGLGRLGLGLVLAQLAIAGVAALRRP